MNLLVGTSLLSSIARNVLLLTLSKGHLTSYLFHVNPWVWTILATILVS